jgi:hypothetical protein
MGIGGGVQGREGVRPRKKTTTRKKYAREKEEVRP